MDATHEFELLATVFYLTTGKIAPGKDAPAASSSGISDLTRRQIWDEWNREHGMVNKAWLKCIEAQIEANAT